MYRVFALLAATSALSNQALAEDQALGARVGTLGFAVEYTYTLSDRIGLRGSINGAGYGFDAEESGIDYAFDLNWDSLSVGVDFHPTRGPLRLSLGLLKNDNSLSAQSRLAGNVDIGGTIYTPAEVGTLRGEIGFDSLAPLAGVGWDWSRKHDRFGIAFDLGVVSQGAPRVTLTADGLLASDSVFQSDLATERSELEAELDGLDLVPFASLGFIFRF